MWEYCAPKDHINTERLFTGSEHKNKQGTWLVAASMHVGETIFNKLFGPKSHYFFSGVTLWGGLFLCIEGTNSVINTGSPQKNRTQKNWWHMYS